MNVSAPLPPGSRIDRYEITALLGTSARGATYRARDPQLDRDVVLREYAPKSLAIRPERSATAARAPVFERVLALLEIDDAAYVVSEFVEGETLDARARRQPLTPVELDALIWPLADGLERLHATGKVQGGIDAAHILLSPDGRPTLIGLNRQDETETRADVRGLSRAAGVAIGGHDAGISPAVLAAIDKGLKGGFADVAEFKAALGERRRVTATAAATPVATAAPAKSRRLSPAMVAGAALCLCIVAIVGIFLVRPMPPASGGAYDGRYIGTLRMGDAALQRTEIVIANGIGKGRATNPKCGAISLILDVAETGYVAGRYSGYDAKCAPSMFGVTGQIKDASLGLVIKCDTCRDALTGNVYRMASPPAAFDGAWSVTHVCPPSGSTKGYTRHYAMSVTAGYGIIQWQTPGQPNSLTLEGQFRADGALQMEGVGLSGSAAYTINAPPEGSPFAYTFVGQVQGRSGRLTDPGNRHCTLDLAKE